MKSPRPESTQSSRKYFTKRAEIANRAYEIWVAANQPAGRDLECWLQAETELRRIHRQAKPPIEKQDQ